MFKMKKILVLIICFLDVTFLSIESSNGKMSTYSPTVQMQKPNNLVSVSGVRQNEKMQRIFYRIGSINSNCLKNFHNQFRYKNRSEYRRPLGIIKPLRMPEFKSDNTNQQGPFLYKIRQNLLHERKNTRRLFGNDRIIFVPPYVNFNEKRVHFRKNANVFKMEKTSQSNSQGNQQLKKVTNEAEHHISAAENSEQVEENNKAFPSNGENREIEKQHTIKNSTIFNDVHDVSKAVEPSSYEISEISQKSNKIKSTTESHFKVFPHHFRYLKKPSQTQPYEVEEIIEEELSVDLNNEKINHVKNIPFDGTAFLSKEIKKVTSSENSQKMSGIQDMMNSSINTVIKTLISPVMRIFPTIENNRETFFKEKVQNHSVSKIHFTSVLPCFTTFSGQRPPKFHKISSSNRPLLNRYEQSKHIKMKNPQISERYQNWTPKPIESVAEPTKIIHEINSNSRVNLMPPLKIEHRKHVYPTGTTEMLKKPLVISKTEKNILNVKKNSQQKTTAVTETESFSFLSSEPKFSDQISYTPLQTQKTLKSSTIQNTLSIKTENLTTVSSEIQTTFNKILPPEEVMVAKSTQSTNLLDDFIENFTKAIITPEGHYVKTDEPPTEITIIKADLTTPDFQSFINYDKTFELITTIKSNFRKNQDVIGKNGRKMNFHYELDKTTMTSLITEFGNTGPRRSDILITENFNDYVDVDNNLSSSNYLDKLKQNNSFPLRNSPLHSTFESIMPLIPVVVGDLREGKISPEDVSILSGIFGKYWLSIIILANVTNLDMLPLLKMKNEEDWNKIWQSFLPETTKNSELTTIVTTEPYAKPEVDDYSPYDYLAEYEDFYEYVFESEKEEKEEKEKRRKKARIKRDEEDNLKKLKVFRKYFESIEEEKDSTTGNIYENMFYTETSKN